MAFYFYTGGDARFQDEAFDIAEATARMADMHRNHEIRNATNEAMRKQLKALQIANPNKEITTDDVQEILEFFNKEAQKRNAQMYSQWTKTASVIEGENGQIVYTGKAFNAALKEIKKNVGKVSQGRAIYDMMKVMQSVYFPELDLSVFDGKHDIEIWKAYNDFINENIAHGENNIFAQAFKSYGKINRAQLGQLKNVIIKYYGNQAQSAADQVQLIEAEAIQTMIERISQIKYTYGKPQQVQANIITYLKRILNLVYAGKKISSQAVERGLRERVKHYSTISKEFEGFFKNTVNISNFMGDFGEALDAMMSGIMDAAASAGEEAALDEYAEYKADQIIQETLGKVNNARVGIRYKIKKPSNTELNSKLAKINQELSTESDLAFSYSVLPKPDANNFLTINGMLVDNARSIKTYSRIGASKIKIPKTGSVEEQIKQFVNTSFNASDEVAIASTVAAPRIMSYLQTLYPDMIIASSSGDDAFNNMVHWAITTSFIDELLGGTGGSLTGSSNQIDWATLFVVNGISMSTFNVINHIAQLQYNSEEYDQIVTGDRAFLNEMDILTFDDYIATLKYSAHLKIAHLLNAIT